MRLRTLDLRPRRWGSVQYVEMGPGEEAIPRSAPHSAWSQKVVYKTRYMATEFPDLFLNARDPALGISKVECGWCLELTDHRGGERSINIIVWRSAQVSWIGAGPSWRRRRRRRKGPAPIQEIREDF